MSVDVSKLQLPPASFVQSDIGRSYSYVGYLGKGAYGVVFVARDRSTGEDVAIKWMKTLSEESRVLSEISIQRQLHNHPNILKIKRVDMYSRDVFIVLELYGCNLRELNRYNSMIYPIHRALFSFQILQALKHMHKKGIMHRDLNPNNILYNSRMHIVLCDFGMSRRFNVQDVIEPMTEYVQTRWYRAPEVCGCMYGKYDDRADVWSAGCIMAEMLLRRPLFVSENSIELMSSIVLLLGQPTAESLDRMQNEKTRAFLRNLSTGGFPDTGTFDRVFHGEYDPLETDLIKKLLAFDPIDRMSAEAALEHVYFDNFKASAFAWSQQYSMLDSVLL